MTHLLNINMASRFTWTQLKQWENAALERRVPQNIPGLIHNSQASQYKWFRRAVSFERNGYKNILNHIAVIRIGFALYCFVALYQQWRVITFGWTEYQEHHCLNFDNIVYDKLSTRIIPYHSPQNWP